MVSVVVSGARGRTGQRLTALLECDPAMATVTSVDATAPAAELDRALRGTDVVIHLGEATAIGAVLAAAGSGGIGSFVYRSSAAVYGAWQDNPVPLTEDVPLRPNPGFSFAIEHAEAERLLLDWGEQHEDVDISILRLAPVVAPGRESWESSTLGRPSSLRRGESLPPAQFLHVDDAAAAFAHAARARLRGTFNVAPDGFVSGETARALAASGLSLPLPDRLASLAEGWAWRLGWGGTPAAAVPYRVHPWVVANDRFRATGWEPLHTNEEALVSAREGSRWRELSPKRRQEMALGAAGVAGVGVAAAAAAAIARVRGKIRTG